MILFNILKSHMHKSGVISYENWLNFVVVSNVIMYYIKKHMFMNNKEMFFIINIIILRNKY